MWWFFASLVLGVAPALDDEGWRVVLKTGEVLRGKLLRQDSEEVEIQTASAVVVLTREEVQLVERLKSSVSPKVTPSGSGGEKDTKAPPAARPVPTQLTRLKAEAVERRLKAAVAGLGRDEATPFETRELDKGRWKWISTNARAPVYSGVRPEPERREQIGPLVYHLEATSNEEGPQWIPYRWDPARGDWTLRLYCPPPLAAYRRLVHRRGEVERCERILSLLDERYKRMKRSEISHQERLANLARAKAKIKTSIVRYVEEAQRALRFLPATAAPRAPARDGRAGASSPSGRRAPGRESRRSVRSKGGN
jgi:hypothetical protein